MKKPPVEREKSMFLKIKQISHVKGKNGHLTSCLVNSIWCDELDTMSTWKYSMSHFYGLLVTTASEVWLLPEVGLSVHPCLVCC